MLVSLPQEKVNTQDVDQGDNIPAETNHHSWGGLATKQQGHWLVLHGGSISAHHLFSCAEPDNVLRRHQGQPRHRGQGMGDFSLH